jgi:hypothetical protein
MGGRLLPITKDKKTRRLREGKDVRRHGAGGGGPDGGHLAGMGQAGGGSRVGVEQQDKALVGLDSPGEVLGIDADQLGAEGPALAQASLTPLGEPWWTR